MPPDYILQLIDCNGDKYVYRRNGRTGTRGQGQLNGPMELDAAVAEFEKLFKSKTGQSWAGRVPGQVPSSAKHYTYLKTNWLARNEEDEAKWMYHLTRDPLGKPDGWYVHLPLDFISRLLFPPTPPHTDTHTHRPLDFGMQHMLAQSLSTMFRVALRAVSSG